MELTFTEESSFFISWCWVCSILLWGSLIITIYTFLTRKNNEKNEHLPVLLSVSAILYIVMLINSFCSSTFSFLGSQATPYQLQSYLENIYRAPPVIQQKIECYHYERRVYYEKDKNGTLHQKVEERKVVTHTAFDNVRIMSYRDISQPLFLDLSSMERNIKFLKLKINPNLLFSNDGSENDYNFQITNFIRMNNFDSHYDHSVTKLISGFKEYWLIPVSSDIRISYLGQGWYTLFTFLTMTEIYKNYVNGLSRYHEYTITKEISTLSPNLFQAQQSIPQFRIITKDFDNLYNSNRGF